MAAAEWIIGDETAKEMLARAMTERPFLLLPPLHRLPLRVGNVVEIVGTSPSAKTEILIQAAVSCILPKEWKGVHYGGLDRLVVFLDLDCSFDILRLSGSLKSRIMEANRVNSSKNDEANISNILKYDTKEEINISYNEELFAMCMRRFLYMRCYDSFEFLATLKTLHYQCQKEREAQKVGAYFLMIDSIGAFHWVDRASTSLPMGFNNRFFRCSSHQHSTSSLSRKRFSLQSVSEAVVQEIQKLIFLHPMLVLATKATILGNQYSVNDINRTQKNWSLCDASNTGTAANSFQKLPYREYMPSVWQSFITHRILLRPSG